ncbi:hypothetical protein AM372_01070 (plasmid) [Klebsiella pneumoniae]|nr:hypothetical protein H218_27670 [Klebsiella pneumoniae DMC1097]ASB10286.1 hypothetical protein AM372_01070 [Klebsiella pneumoniae]
MNLEHLPPELKQVAIQIGVASENGIYGHSRFCNTDFDDKLACLTYRKLKNQSIPLSTPYAT